MSNIINKFVQKIPATLSDENIKTMLETVLNELEQVYSYLVYVNYDDDNNIRDWQIQYNISQTDEYNTLKSDIIIPDILNTIVSSKEKKVSHIVSYKQPPLELMIELYKPLIKRLAKEESQRWVQLEYDDCYQMCLMTMLKLYRKNYYLHKTLLERSFRNDILLSIKKDRDKPSLLPIEGIIYRDGDNEALTLSDMLPDKNESVEQENEDAFIKAVFDQTKDIVIDLLGERTFEQLMNDYVHRHTTSWSQKTMNRLKTKLKMMGITWKSFDSLR